MVDILSTGALAEAVLEVTTSATPLVLTGDMNTYIRLVGSQRQTIRLPLATSLREGQRYVLMNRSTALAVLQFQNSGFFLELRPDKEIEVRLVDNSTANGSWDRFKTGQSLENVPLKLHASSPPDAFLHIGPSSVAAEDGAAKIAAPIDDLVTTTGLISINMQTGAISGGTVTDGVGGPALTFPATTVGEFRRLVFAAQADNTIAASFSAADPVRANLTNAGTLLDALDGQKIGGIDLEATGATAFKSAGSATAVIEHEVGGVAAIFRFGSGSGGSNLKLLDGGFETEIDTTETTYSIDSGKVNFHPFMHVLTGHTLTVPSGARLVSTDDTVDGTVVVESGGIWKVL